MNYTEPTWGTSLTYEPTSTFNRRPVLSADMTAALVRILQFHFGDADNIDREELKRYIWNQNRDSSKILIAPDYLKNPKDIGKMPVVYVGRLKTEFQILGLEEGGISYTTAGGTVVTLADPELITRLGVNVHGVFSRGMNGAESEALSDEIFHFLTAYSRIIARDLKLQNFYVRGVDQSKKMEQQDTDQFLYPIQIMWSDEYSYKIVEDLPI